MRERDSYQSQLIGTEDTDRSSRFQSFFKIGVLKSFAIFKEKHLSWSLFLIKLQAFTHATLLKRDSYTSAFL